MKRRLPRAELLCARPIPHGAGASVAAIRSCPGMQCQPTGTAGAGPGEKESKEGASCSSPMPGSPITKTLCGPSIAVVHPDRRLYSPRRPRRRQARSFHRSGMLKAQRRQSLVASSCDETKLCVGKECVSMNAMCPPLDVQRAASPCYTTGAGSAYAYALACRSPYAVRDGHAALGKRPPPAPHPGGSDRSQHRGPAALVVTFCGGDATLCAGGPGAMT